jgi:uroporphyrinogen-III synthase
MDSERLPPVVLTRSPEDNAALERLLIGLGLEVEAWPAMETRMTPPQGGSAELLRRLEETDWVVFSSRRGVAAAVAITGEPELVRALSRRALAAVGASTAQALENLGLAVALTGDGSGAAALAPRLVAAVAPGARVALVRSGAADDGLPDALRAAGLGVDDLRLHEPVEPAGVLVPAHDVLCVVCASPSAARRVLSWNPWSAVATFVAIGPTTARALAGLGVTRVVTADGPDAEALAAAVRRIAVTRARPATSA